MKFTLSCLKKFKSWYEILPRFLWVWKISEISGWYGGFISKLWIIFCWFIWLYFYLLCWAISFESLKIWNTTVLTLFWPMLPFYTPWKHQKTFGFLVFSRDIKWEHWPEMGWAFKCQPPQNGQTHSSNSSPTADELFRCVWPLCRVGA